MIRKILNLFKRKKTHGPIYYDQFRIGDNWLSTNKDGFGFAFDAEARVLTCFRKNPDGTTACYDVGNYDADLLSDGHEQSDKVWLITVYRVPRFACVLSRKWIYHKECEEKEKLANRILKDGGYIGGGKDDETNF